jgi:predicted phosphoribosyltransferase
VPVAAADVLARLAPDADRAVCLHAPRDLMAVGQFYDDFRQVEDGEVVAMLRESRPVPGA